MEYVIIEEEKKFSIDGKEYTVGEWNERVLKIAEESSSAKEWLEKMQNGEE